MPTRNINNNLTVFGDGAEMFLKSADHNVARIIPRGTGSNLDKGLLSLFDTGTEDVRIDTAGNSWFNGGNIGIGQGSPTAKLHLKGDGGSSGLTFKTTDYSNNEIFYVMDGGRVGVRYHPFSIGVPSTTSLATNAVFQVEEAGLLTVLSTGNVGIGVNDPDSKLEIKGSGTGSGGTLRVKNSNDSLLLQVTDNGVVSVPNNYFYVSSSAGAYVQNALRVRGPLLNDQGTLSITGDVNFDSNTMFVDSTNNRVGIGTNNPSHLLHVYAADGVAVDSYISLVQNAEATAGDNFGLKVQAGRNSSDVTMEVSNAVGTSYMRVRGDGNVGIGTTNPAARLHTKETGTVNSAIFENSGQAYAYAAIKVNEAQNNKAGLSFAVGDALASTHIQAEIHGLVTNNGGALTGDLVFKTNQGDNLQERMRILANGNVGIGTTSPYSVLQVGDTEQVSPAELTIASRYHGGGPMINFRSGHPSNSNVWNMGRILCTDDGNYNGRLEFRTTASGGHTGTQPATRMVIKATGNVGIGTTSPAQKLHVNGNVDIDNGGILLQQGYGTNFGVSGYDIVMPTTTRLGIKTAGGERMSILNNGYVGIGVTTPSRQLVVANSMGLSGTHTYIFGGDNEILAGQDGSAYYYATGNGQNLTKPVFIGDNNSYIRFNSGNAERMRITSAGEVLIGRSSNVTSQKLQVNGFIDITDVTGSALRWYDGSTFRGGLGLDDWATSNSAADLTLYGVNNLHFVSGGGNNRRMTIHSGGNVGIGTISPTKALDVRAEARVWNGSNGIELSYSTGNGSGIVASANTSGTLEFRTNIGAAAKMFITNAGNVGIGTTSPDAKLVSAGIVDGDFTALRLMNQKTYGSGTGTNEKVRFVMGISESGTAFSAREGFAIDVGVIDQSDSSNAIVNFGVRDGGTLGTYQTVNGHNKSVDFAGTVTANGLKSPYLESASTNQSLFIRPNGSGHVYLGDSGNGTNLYHYSNANNGQYTTYGWGNYYTISTTAPSGIKIDDPLTVSGLLSATTASFSGKVDFQGDAAIEGGSGYGVFKGYSGNDNHFISIRGVVANSSTLSITGGHQTTFVEHADAADEGWYFKSKTSGSYREIARIDGLGDMYLEGNQRVFADNYHPNADTLTTARTITLAGDVTGNVSFNGSSNVSITTAVANDSHTHDGRYYTESEVVNHFKTLAVQGNFMNTYSWSGDTVGSANNGWSDFGSSPFSGNGTYGQNGTDAENSRSVESLPNGAKGVVWQTPSNDAGSGADGGWNCTINGVDSTKAYRSVIYFRRTDDSTSGTFYHGCHGSHTLNISGSAATNPYFHNIGYSNFVEDRWYVSIGYIQPYQSSGATTSSKSGIYDCTTGKKVFGGQDFMMKNGSTSQQHRTYLYYSTDTATSIDFYGPRFEELNSNEPSIQELVNKGLDGLAAMSFHSKYDPEALSQLTETSDANDDKFLLWDESASVWKYMRLDDLQDSIDNNTTYSVGDGGLTQKNFTTTLKDKLDNIEPNATADQTAAQILAAIKTVDVNGTAGVNAGTFDGLQLHTGRNNGANKVVRTNSNGYLDTGFINTTSGDIGSAIPSRIYTNNNGSGDAYVRYADLASFRSLMNVTARASFQGREQVASDQNYWVGTMGWGTVDFDTIFGYGSGHIDSWSSPTNQPSTETSHWVGHQSMHYTNGSNHYGHQFLVGAGNPAYCYLRGKWGGTTYSWAKMWNSANDGSGSGLDADTLDGYEGSYYATTNDLALKLNLSGGTMTGHLNLGDSDRVKLGQGGDLQFVHDGSNSYIHNVSVGDLYLRQTADNKNIILESDNGSGGSTAYLTINGSTERIENLKNVFHYDNVRAQFGDGADLQIYHDSSHSYIDDSGTGNLNIKSNSLRLLGANSTSMLVAHQGGAVNLYHDNSAKLATTASGIYVAGNVQLLDSSSASDGRITFGNGNDLQIYHDGSNSYIRDGGAGELIISGGQYVQIKYDSTTAGGLLVRDGDNALQGYLYADGASTPSFGLLTGAGQWGVRTVKNGLVELRYNNATKLQTTGGGVTVTGQLSATTGSFNNGSGNGGGVGLTVDGSGDIKVSSGGSLFFGLYNYANSTYIRGHDSSTGLQFFADGQNLMNMTSSLVSISALTVSGVTTLSGNNNHYAGHHFFDSYDSNGNHYPHYLHGSSGSAKVNIRVYNAGGGSFDTLYIAAGSNNMTWRGNKIWNAGNDGSGSGLDADTVDGIQGSSFLRSDTSDTSTGGLTTNFFRTNASTTSYSLITRDTGASNYVLYVQSPQSGGTQKIATFGYGSANAGQATEVFRIARGNINAYSSNLTVGGTITGTSKNFSIPHPTKEGKRLIHSCIEGPEVAVYFRGRSQSNTIEMPDYWGGLVDLDSMTVELTAIGPNQDLYVEDIADDGEVTVGSNTETSLNYFYVVYGERKDIDKLEVEIEDTGEFEAGDGNSEE